VECTEDCIDYVPGICYHHCVSRSCLYLPPCTLSARIYTSEVLLLTNFN
jgi:hypothetical protein